MQELAAPLPLSVSTASETTTSNFRHIPALDGVRGIAILVVMVYHLAYLVPSWLPYVGGGFFGVDIFFVLSGFLITSILLGEYENTGRVSLPNFYVRRFLRLMPAFWLFLICIYLLGTYLMPPFEASLVYGRNDFLYAITYTINWFSASNPGFDSNLNHAWSLSIEEQFYIIWSIVLWKAFAEKRTPRQILFVTLGFIAALCISRAVRAATGTEWRMLYYSTDTRIDALLIGCAASLAFFGRCVSTSFVRSYWFKAICFVAVLGIIVPLFSFSHEDRALYIFGLPVFTLSVGC